MMSAGDHSNEPKEKDSNFENVRIVLFILVELNYKNDSNYKAIFRNTRNTQVFSFDKHWIGSHIFSFFEYTKHFSSLLLL